MVIVSKSDAPSLERIISPAFERGAARFQIPKIPLEFLCAGFGPFSGLNLCFH
jgi:hypothetical protein